MNVDSLVSIIMILLDKMCIGAQEQICLRCRPARSTAIYTRINMAGIPVRYLRSGRAHRHHRFQADHMIVYA